MSSPDALATVTATMQHLLSNVAPAATVTTEPPSTARNGVAGDQINIFLYSTYFNTAFSNAPMPGASKNGELAFPPLPLVLKYLITTYGNGDDDIAGQQLMGQAMSLLHDHPLLGSSDIEGITPNSNLHQQIERIRITPDMLTLDDMSKLWTSFQSAEYRLSTGYEVSVVLIESSRAAKTPLPVLKRGEDDQGVSAQADLIPLFPAIGEIILPNQQASALLGDTITIDGHHLDGDPVEVHFNHSQLPTASEIPVLAGGTADQITVQIPNDPANWIVGFYTVNIVINKAGEQQRITNLLPLPIAPRILGIAPPNPIARDGAGNVTITISCSPEIRRQQRASILLGDREVLRPEQTDADPATTNTLVFFIEEAHVGKRFIRLRIDGIDSQLVDHTVTPPEFNSAMEVTIS